MGLDKFLKVSRIIKRRTVANEACNGSRIKVNDKIAKPSHEVKAGDIVEVMFGDNSMKFEILRITEHISKDSAGDLYRVLG